MCGLVGVCGTDAPGRARIPDLLNAMAHRGPDDDGLWQDDVAVLGHRRLAIMDLSSHSHQPAITDDGRRVIAYNGEIYNHPELVVPARASDTLALCGQTPSIQADRLQGMFALAVWDAEDECLELTRDRFGIKPLYYSAQQGHISFSSYACSTAAASEIATVDRAALASYLRFGSVQAPRTIFSGVKEVEPGSSVTWHAGDVSEHRYWQFPVRPRHRTKQDVEDSLRESVRVHTLSDVPVAVFLSAGVDSTLVTALAADLELDVQAITIGLPGHDLDEGREAALSAQRLGVPHQIVNLTDDDVDFEAFFDAMDQPSIDGLNTYLVAQAAKEAGFRVALTGLGADELFAGYSLFRRLPAVAAAGRLLPRSAREKLLRRIGNPTKAQEAAEAGSDLTLLHDVLRSVWSLAEVERLTGLSPERSAPAGPGRLVDRLTQLELEGYVRNTLLRDADVYGMAHSVEIRTPFLDHVVLETALGYSQWARVLPSKRILKGMLAGRGLEHVLERKKSGFVLPYAEWLAGPLAERVKQLASGPLSEAFGADRARNLLGERGEMSTMQLWSLVVLDAWLRREDARRKDLTIA